MSADLYAVGAAMRTGKIPKMWEAGTVCSYDINTGHYIIRDFQKNTFSFWEAAKVSLAWVEGAIYRKAGVLNVKPKLNEV